MQIAPIDVPPAGHQTLGWRVSVHVSLQGLEIDLYEDFVVAFADDAVLPMLFVNPGSPFPPDLEASLVTNVASRA